jgi:predicted nucleic acid-binding protein
MKGRGTSLSAIRGRGMADFVVDASAAAKKVLDEPHAREYRKWFRQAAELGHVLHSSSLAGYEVAEAIRKQGRGDADEALTQCLAGLDLHDAWSAAARFANPLTIYDASYLAVAVQQRATLVTYDEKLAAVARREGVKVLVP